MRAERPAITAEEAQQLVEALPRRVAHATYALLALRLDGSTPAKTAEVCVRDREALTVSATGNALRRALGHDLVDRWAPGLWTPRPRAIDLHGALEDRFLRETGDGTTRDERERRTFKVAAKDKKGLTAAVYTLHCRDADEALAWFRSEQGPSGGGLEIIYPPSTGDGTEAGR